MENDILTGRMLRIGEASRLLNVHKNTLIRWGDQGVVKAYRIGPRGDRRFEQEDIENLLVRLARDREAGIKRWKF